ncbi:HNH endonuclease [Nostoc linckia z18]|uniref:HNH endonuclease n=3 Tax=Nostoc linckia TaxID=92942 RepID=A0A9Q5ZCA2_NOSLI|nr:HNH endonuclease [Nostoc linckia z1]PHJ61905.1 HNH endonuclease [Nostoc linckia z3]PHJ67822.1 HNH endonuclease [Nostoc linckia z2]PHJ79002.1 HNH endonuclease [Nostoc linckia z4]PHJ83329.1 HNH endonuclease [Nostoc linckia z6]PHJ95630.1 HNH endonuclease [Nostoc linckia z7]PHK03552.1 HNH endonuclease [Nostoc linckia z8]PHK09763.1 HNH endonuclease [Nostoc linckia z9]PHK19898.1 HNH endonuclease [Nostoc linckia z14]PHK25629.1 HNH endonuclease [Nostoc linckia z13]PHK34399.1 HNH endonuclease [
MVEMTKNLAYYINKFANLRVSRSSGIAPNKPILLLSIIELISQGEIRRNQVPLSAELIATFFKLWSHLEPVRKPDIGQPFFYLRNDGFWHFQPNLGFELTVTSKAKIVTPGAIRQAVEYAYLDDELWQILQNPQERSILTHVLIDSWFSDKTQDIEQLLQVNAFAELQNQLQRSGGKVYQPEELEDEQAVIVRDGAFRKIVVSTYNHTCAFCGLQILDSLGQNIVDGSHIKPFSQFYDDRINNGLSLCKNHHWAFDRFWFTINDDYTIIVADNLREVSPNAKPMQEFRGDRIILPAQEQYYPRQDSLQWHREEFSRRAA